MLPQDFSIGTLTLHRSHPHSHIYIHSFERSQLWWNKCHLRLCMGCTLPQQYQSLLHIYHRQDTESLLHNLYVYRKKHTMHIRMHKVYNCIISIYQRLSVLWRFTKISTAIMPRNWFVVAKSSGRVNTVSLLIKISIEPLK